MKQMEKRFRREWLGCGRVVLKTVPKETKKLRELEMFSLAEVLG